MIGRKTIDPNNINRWLETLLISFFFFLPFERIPTFDFAGYTLKISYILALIIFILVIFRRPFIFSDRSRPDLSERFLAVFWFFSFLTVGLSPTFKRSLVIAAMWAFVFWIYLILSRLLKNKTLREKVEDTIIVSTVVICLFGLYQFLADSFGVSSTWTGLRSIYTKSIFGFPRIQSVALEPLYYANFLLVPLFITLKRYVESNSYINKYWWIALLITTEIVMCISRGAYLGLAVSLPVFIIYLLLQKETAVQYRRAVLGIITKTALSIALAVLLISTVNGQSAGQAFVDHAKVEDTKTGSSIPGRMETYKIALDLFKEKPIFGNGLGSFGPLTAQSVKETKERGYGTVNNEYLEILAENGLLGLILFFGFLILILKDFFTFYHTRNIRRKTAAVALFLGLLAVFVQYNFFSTLYIIYIWAFLALFRAELQDH